MGLRHSNRSYGSQTTKKGKPGESWGRKVMDLGCLNLQQGEDCQTAEKVNPVKTEGAKLWA